ncbi:MAG: GMC family oxidoreductase N-terminal domain-containing protein [Bacteroidia bacterium]|nr:GMC family oxidoreductase N-terminal domain-containing protein [Bacteroidia bacterium]
MYDYIIIGGGTAGCVLAYRLTEDPNIRVLMVEAGGKDKSRLMRIPAAFSKLFKTEFDWNYSTPPQPHSANRSYYLPRGKVLGGCSNLNAMIYIRGNRKDYDYWEKMGNKGWSYADVLPYFKKSEFQTRGGNHYHGVNGPFPVTDLNERFPITDAFVEAGKELGYAFNPDFNGENQEGFGFYQVNQKNGKRFSVSDAFLKPALKRPNLTVLTNTPVRRIIIENHRAVGIEYQSPTHIQQVKAQKEIILTAGAYNSPQLLMLSGIGDANELEKNGIKPLQHLPGVGKNLQDHLIFPMVFHNKDTRTLENAEKLSSLFHYLIWGEGPLSSNVAEGGAFIHTRSGLEGPDIQFHFAPGFFMNHGFDTPPKGHGFSYGPTLLQPESVGEVSLSSDNPLAAPIIDHRYFSENSDLETLVAGFEVGRELVQTSALKKYFEGYFLPGRALRNKEEIRTHILRNAQTLYHPAGTCKMGTDEMAVVDDRLAVFGIEGLRVADASVMPKVIRGNTHAPVLMIAEKAADMLLGQTLVLPENQVESANIH